MDGCRSDQIMDLVDLYHANADRTDDELNRILSLSMLRLFFSEADLDLIRPFLTNEGLNASKMHSHYLKG